MTEVDLRCVTCGQPLPTLSRTELGERFVQLVYPGVKKTDDGGFQRSDGTTFLVRTSKLNAQSDRPTRRWSFSKGTIDDEPDQWLWIGFDPPGGRILRAWVVPAAEWTTRVTHLSESATSQWASFQTFPSDEHPEPLAAHEIQESIMVAQHQPVTNRNFQRGTFKRYVSIMKFNIGSLSNNQHSVDIERNEYIHFDGFTLRFNADSPNQSDWVDYPNVASRTIIGAINNGWLREVPDGVYVDVSQWGFQPPSANIRMSAADPYKAAQQGKSPWAPGGVVHQEDAQVGSVGQYVGQVNQQNNQAWNKRFAHMHQPGQAAMVQHHQQQVPQHLMIGSSTAGMSGQTVPMNQGPQFIAQQPLPPSDYAAMNPVLAGGSNVEPQDARVVAQVPIRVPAKQGANIATGRMNDGRVAYDRDGNVAPRPAMVTAFSSMDQQGTAGLGLVRDRNGNIIGQSGQFGMGGYGQFGPGQYPGPQQQMYPGQQYPGQQYPGQGLQPAYQQPMQPQMQPGQMMSEGISFQTTGVGAQAQQATGTVRQASTQAFGGGEQIVGRVGQTRGQQPLSQGQLVDPHGNPMTPAARQMPTETPVMRNPDGSPVIVTGPSGHPMMIAQVGGQLQYVAPMVVPGPDGQPILVPPGQTVSEEQMAASVPVTETGDINPEEIEMPEQPEVTPEHKQIVEAAQPAPAQAPQVAGPPPLHPEAVKLLEGRKPVKELETRIIGSRMFWPNFPENWPFKAKPELRLKLAELHQEYPAVLKAIYMAESTAFQTKMLERWPNLLAS